tara:strand:+ start:672 stop:857 length:186 start_codon:yes stop_codon:yes gene_type:complete
METKKEFTLQKKVDWLISVCNLKDVQIEELREDKKCLNEDLKLKEERIMELENELTKLMIK